MDMSKLKKMKMPAKMMAEKEAAEDLDLESLGTEATAPAAVATGVEEGVEAGVEMGLADVSDEELLAEVKARGLSLEDAMSGEAEEEEIEG